MIRHRVQLSLHLNLFGKEDDAPRTLSKSYQLTVLHQHEILRCLVKVSRNILGDMNAELAMRADLCTQISEISFPCPFLSYFGNSE